MAETIYSQTELREMIVPILRRYNADHALLFGSYARNEATTGSDIDLLVFGKPEFRPFDIFAIAEDLHECSGKKVDVYEVREINSQSALYLAAMSEGVRIQ